MNRPLVSVVIAYAAGLLLAPFFQPPPIALLAVTFLMFVIALAYVRLRSFLIWPLLALAGSANLAVHNAVIAPNDLRTLLGQQPALVTVRGQLAATPRLKITVRDGQENWRSVALVRVREIRRAKKFQPATGEIQVTTPGLLAFNLFAGQSVEISGVIARPPPPLAEGMFDFQSYLATRGIYYQLKAESTNDWKLLASVQLKPPLTDRFLSWSKNTLALGLPAEDKYLRLIWAMTLGWHTAFTGDIGDPFLRAGTMHLFAIDGLRIALLSGILVALLRGLRLSRAWCGAVAVPAIWFYTAATGWEPSAIRASVMMTIILGGWALKRPSDLLNSLAAAALIILVWNPNQLFEASFQLSFFVMLIIALMLPPLNRFFDQMIQPDPLLPGGLLSRRQKMTFGFSRWLARYSGLSFAAWMGSIPLAAKYFHLFSPISTLANVVAVPLGTFALMANLGALVCGHWLPWFTEIFNNAAWFFMAAMTWVSVEAARIPGAYFYVPAPSAASIVIYYAVLIAAFSGWFMTRPRKILGTAILSFIGAIYLWQWQSARGETDLTVLPLNGGHAIYVDAAGRKNDWQMNCGDENAVRFTLKEFLHAQGVNSLPRLVLTEGSVKNCGGALALDELVPVGKLWTGAVKFRSPAYRAAVVKFEQPLNRHAVLAGGATADCWQALFSKPAAHIVRADDAALVLRGNFHGTKILLLSDLNRAGQNALLARTNDLRADIVVAGLPMEGEPLGDALIDAIRPKVIVIADSEFPATRRAPRELKKRLAGKNVPVIYTREAGAVTVAVTDDGWQLRAMNGQIVSQFN